MGPIEDEDNEEIQCEDEEIDWQYERYCDLKKQHDSRQN